MQLLGCFSCGDPEHWAENCPELVPAETRKEHEARIDKYVEWCNGSLPLPGRITPRQKQELIKAENARWKQLQATKGKAA